MPFAGPGARCHLPKSCVSFAVDPGSHSMHFKILSSCFAAALMPCAPLAQALPPLSTCADPDVPACSAIPGDRAEGWRGQSRAEVMAPHAMVTTSQPLAAQAGLQVMQRGGNAIDAAGATAAV